MNYKEFFKLEMGIDSYLFDILNYSESAYDYLTGNKNELDSDEIIMYLSTVPECIEAIKEFIYKLEEKYEKEINDLNEQLQQINK